MISTIALMENGTHQVGSGSGAVLMLNTLNLELKKDKFWVEYDDEDKKYIISNKTKGTVEKVEDLDDIAEIICVNYSVRTINENGAIPF